MFSVTEYYVLFNKIFWSCYWGKNWISKKSHIFLYSLAKSTVLVSAEQVVASGSEKKDSFLNLLEKEISADVLKKN